jgi:hypothetical protein
MSPQQTIADDMLDGAKQIAQFLYGDEKLTRRVYYLTDRKKLPVFRLGSGLKARRSVLLEFVEKQEHDNFENGRLALPHSRSLSVQ